MIIFYLFIHKCNLLILSYRIHGETVYEHSGPRTIKGFTEFVKNPPPPKVEEEVEIEYVDETGEEERIMSKDEL